MKKIGLILLIICSLFIVTGCGNKNSGEEVVIPFGDNTTESSNVDLDDLELYSDDTKIVFERGESKAVFYYSGDKVTAYHAYFDYGNATTANYMLGLINQNDSVIDKAYVKGKYLVIEYKDSEYENMTVEELRTVYSYLKEVKKGD